MNARRPPPSGQRNGSIAHTHRTRRLQVRAREPLSTPHTFLHVLSGALFARVTGEDEPSDLVAGDSLWVRDPRLGDELDLTGRGEGTAALIVRIDEPRE